MSIDINTPWGAVIKGVTDIIDKVIPDPAQRDKAKLGVLTLQQNGQLEELKATIQLALAQAQLDNTEASSPSLFKSGWRPFIGWTCGGGLFYQFIFRPIGGWIIENWVHWPLPPSLDLTTLMPLLFGMLGLGAMRTVEKIKGVD